MTLYAGNHPEAGEWDLLLISKVFDGAEWFIYYRDNDDNGRYLSVKVVADGYVENKANYWLSWDKDRKRLTSRGADLKVLRDNRRGLYDMVLSALRDANL